MYQLDANGRRPRLDYDPDEEVHGWSWVDVRDGLPPGIMGNLHVPKNQLLMAIGLLRPEEVRLKGHTPPRMAQHMAMQGLHFSNELRRSGTPAGVAMAKKLLQNQTQLSDDDVLEMARYHKMYGDYSRETDVHGAPTVRAIDHMLWGGEFGAKWAAELSSSIRARRGMQRLSTEEDNTSKTTRSMKEVQSDIQKAGAAEEKEEETPKYPEPKKKSDAEMKKAPSDYLDEEDVETEEGNKKAKE